MNIRKGTSPFTKKAGLCVLFLCDSLKDVIKVFVPIRCFLEMEQNE